MRTPPRCPRCRTILEEPRELPDALPGVKYRECLGCGYTVAVRKPQRRERLNPLLGVVGNPPPGRTRRAGEKMATSVHEIRYTHVEDGENYRHPFETDDVEMFAMPDGSIRIASRTGRRLWDEFD